MPGLNQQGKSVAGQIDCDAEVRRLLKKALKYGPRCKSLSYRQIADLLTGRLGTLVTANMLYLYQSKARPEVRLPASFISAVSEVSGDYSLADLLGKRKK